MVTGYVDVVVLALMPDVGLGLAKAVGGPLVEGYPAERYIEKMDEAGVAISILIASKGGGHQLPGGGTYERWEIPVDGIKRIIDSHSDRFRGIVGIDPTEPERSLREIESAVRNDGFVGVHLYPHWWKEPPDSKLYYPFYEKCVELDVPIQLQVGSSLVPFLPSVGRPLTLEQVAIDFPDLKIIGSHTGWPWVEEMVAVMQNHPNVYTTTSTHYPKTHWENPVTGLRPLPRWDDCLVEFANLGWIVDGSRGEDKVLLGTDFPEWEYSIAIEEAREVLTPSAFEKVCRDNAAILYKLH